MELRQLRYFMAVADELHFGRAAQTLHMSQPPLSVQVGRLEREIGIALFERSTRKVSLTPAGRHLQGRARQILQELEVVQAEMRDYVDGYSGQLTVGFVSSANYTVLPGVVQMFRTRRANVDLKLVPLTSGEQLERLREGSLDVGIVRDEFPWTSSDSTPLITEVVFEERLVACLPINHPLALQDVVAPDEIAAVPMITYPRSQMTGYVDRVTEVLASAATAIEVVEEVVHQETALGFVAAGVGASILPESVRHLVPPSIAIVPLEGSPTTKLMAIRPARADRHAASTTFIEFLHEAAGELSEVRKGQPPHASPALRNVEDESP